MQAVRGKARNLNEKEKFWKFLKIFQKSLKKRLTSGWDLWYYIQALAEKGGSAGLKLG